jgi:hypothetical protein
MHWLRDYGAFIAASVAAVVAFGTGWLAARREKRMSDERWQRELRLPRYVEFVRTADTLDWATVVEFGEWEPEMGPRPTGYPPSQDAWRDFRQASADVSMVGPVDVVVAAQRVEFSIRQYQARLQENPWAGTPLSVDRMRTEFIQAASSALGLHFSIDATRLSYAEWDAEQHLLDDEQHS